MPYSWFRLYSEMRTDPKMLRLTPAERWCWVGLLCMASDASERGLIQITEGVPYEEIELAHALDVDIDDVQGVLRKGAQLRMLEVTGDGIRILNFQERQYDKPSDTPEQVRARVARSRARNAQSEYAKPVCNADETPCNADVTPSQLPCNATEQIQNRTDTEQNRADIRAGDTAIGHDPEIIQCCLSMWLAGTAKQPTNKDFSTLVWVMDTYGDDATLYAFQEAIARGAMAWPYIKKILKNHAAETVPKALPPLKPLPDVIVTEDWTTGATRETRTRDGSSNDGPTAA